MESLVAIEFLNLNLHLELIRLYTKIIPSPLRKILEYFILFIAIGILSLLVILHFFYLNPSCLEKTFEPVYNKTNKHLDCDTIQIKLYEPKKPV